MTDITIEKASPRSINGAKLNLMAVGDNAHPIVGSKDPDIIEATFQELWRSRNNRFSHQYAYEAKMGERTLGMITCLPVTILEKLVSSTAKQLLLYRKLNLITYNLMNPRAFISTVTLKEGFKGEYHIATLAAMPESRGLGIGSRLIQHAEEQAISQGYRTSSLTVKKENHLAAKLYTKLGYEITSEINKHSISMYRMVKQLT